MPAIDDRHAIQDLPARYARIADQRQFDALREIFVSDAHFVIQFSDRADRPPLLDVKGVDAIIQAFGVLQRYERTFHFIGQQLIDDLQSAKARTETYCMANHFHTKQGVAKNIIWYIRYHDELVKQNGAWKIHSRTLLIDRAEGEDV